MLLSEKGNIQDRNETNIKHIK